GAVDVYGHDPNVVELVGAGHEIRDPFVRGEQFAPTVRVGDHDVRERTVGCAGPAAEYQAGAAGGAGPGNVAVETVAGGADVGHGDSVGVAGGQSSDSTSSVISSMTSRGRSSIGQWPEFMMRMSHVAASGVRRTAGMLVA